jgi:adenylosuccinate synthase
MAKTIIVGAQWGDEGKGKIIDVLSEAAEVIVRSQGGSNAGHTVVHNGVKYILHLIPSGILHPGKVCVIGNGVVIDPTKLVKEIQTLRSQGVVISPENLIISESAHLVLPYHCLMDGWMEEQRGEEKIGTTLQGIGPAYADKINRVGIRVHELRDPARLRTLVEGRLATARALLGSDPALAKDPRLDAETIVRDALTAAEILLPHVRNTIGYLHEAIAAGKEMLFEGAQGTFLDIDFGTYPYVTSSATTSGGACTGTGVPPNRIDDVTGVIKAYTTRVGGGPFPTEDEGLSDRLHNMGREFGATTGRARRCGWLDGAMLKYAVLVNGNDRLAITNVDGLDGLETLRICKGYTVDGQFTDLAPSDIRQHARCEPVYVELPGWNEDTSAAKKLEDLPANAVAYLRKVAEIAGAPIAIVSTGPARAQTMILETPLK